MPESVAEMETANGAPQHIRVGRHLHIQPKVTAEVGTAAAAGIAMSNVYVVLMK